MSQLLQPRRIIAVAQVPALISFNNAINKNDPCYVAADDSQRGTPNFPFGQDGSEERIAKILNEANKAINSSANKDVPGTPPASTVANPMSFSSQVSF